MIALPFTSLRSRLFLVVVAAITPFVLYAILSAARVSSVAGSTLRNESLARAKATARTVDDQLQRLDQLLDSAMVRVRQPVGSSAPLAMPGDANSPLAGALSIAVLDQRGQRTALLMGDGARVDAIPTVRRLVLIGTALGSAQRKRPASSTPATYVDEGLARTASDSIAMIIVRPVKRSITRCDCPADAPGALVAVLSDAAVHRLLGSDTLPAGGVVVMTGSAGSLLGRPQHPDRWGQRDMRDTALLASAVEREGTLHFSGPDDVNRAVGFAALTRLPWRVYVGVPAAAISTLPTQQVRDALMLTVLALVIAAVGVVVATRAHSGPLQTLIADTRRLAAGTFSLRTDVAGTAGDIGALGASINTLAAELETRRTALNDDLRRAMQLFELSPMPMWVAEAASERGAGGRIIQINPAAIRFFGKTVDALAGQRDRELLDPRSAAVLDDTSTNETGITVRALLRTLQHGVWEHQVHIAPLVSVGQPLRMVTVIDGAAGSALAAAPEATPIASGEAVDDAAQSAAVASRVALAGRVADEFTEVLLGLDGFARLAADSADDADMRSVALERVLELAARALGAARQLQAFGQRDTLALQVIDVNDTIAQAAQAMAEPLGRDVELDVLFNISPATVEADPRLLDQVVTTLIANARDAMPAGGTLTLATTLVEVPADGSTQYAAPPGRYIVLTVADTGMGMSAESRRMMFEPFWSTKRTRRYGDGLGLAAVDGIVREHGWHISVDSELEIGTAISIYMPASEVQLEEAPAMPDQPSFETAPSRSA